MRNSQSMHERIGLLVLENLDQCSYPRTQKASRMCGFFLPHDCRNFFFFVLQFATFQTGREEIWPFGRNAKNRFGKSKEN